MNCEFLSNVKIDIFDYIIVVLVINGIRYQLTRFIQGAMLPMPTFNFSIVARSYIVPVTETFQTR